jgi:hypothetical protein
MLESEDRGIILGKLKENYEKQRTKSTTEIPIVINIAKYQGNENLSEEADSKSSLSNMPSDSKPKSNKIENEKISSNQISEIKSISSTKKKRCRFLLFKCFY